MSKSFRPYPTALLNPCADPTFKILFTSSNDLSQAALTEFLCDILGKSVTEVTLQPSFLEKLMMTSSQNLTLIAKSMANMRI